MLLTFRQPEGKPPLPQRGKLPNDGDTRTLMPRKIRSKKGSKTYCPAKVDRGIGKRPDQGRRGLWRSLLKDQYKVNC